MQFRHFVMWVGLVWLAALLVFSVYGSFLGADKARVFFNSLGLGVFWFLMLGALCGSLLILPGVRKRPGLLLVHLGGILIIGGSLWASATGHELRGKYLKSDRVAKAYTFIDEGGRQKQLYDQNQQEVGELPFDLYLDDFRIDYYWERGKVYVYTPEGEFEGEFAAKVGEVYELKDGGTIEISRLFKNYRRDSETGSDVEGPEGEVNPALKVRWRDEKGELQGEGLYFQNFQQMQPLAQAFQLVYSLMPRDYYSDITVYDGDKVTKQTVEVNYPLHYGGYYFFQHSYDSKNHAYTVLSVTSDAGFGVVYSGYALMCGGLMWHCWVVPIQKRRRKAEVRNAVEGGANNGH